MAHDVFISYASHDKLTADAACAVLESKGLRCWIAPRDILPGVDWGEAIVNAIGEVGVFLLVFSSNANNSNQIKREVERAAHRGIPIIPLRIEDVNPTKSLEYFISSAHWLDAFSPPLQQHLNYLSDVIQRLLLGQSAAPPEVEVGGPTGRGWRPGWRSASAVGLALLMISLAAVFFQHLPRSAPAPASAPKAVPESPPDTQPRPLVGAALNGAWKGPGFDCNSPTMISVEGTTLTWTLSGRHVIAQISPGSSDNTIVTHSVDGEYFYHLRGDNLDISMPNGQMELARC
jgi:hypothetical protein